MSDTEPAERRDPISPPAAAPAGDSPRGEFFEALYHQRFSPRERARRRRIWAVLCRHFFSRYIRPTDAVLDLGAGLCDFIDQIDCARKFALDVTPAVRELASPEVTTFVADARRLPTLGLPPLDVVFASNVFEHVPTKTVLIEILHAVRASLRPGGRLIAMQPNLRYVGGEYWDFLDHHIPLTHRTMEEVLTITGFELEEVRPRFLPYTTKSLLPQHPALVWLYLQCPPLHRLLGKQMLIVASKPSWVAG